MTACVEMYTNFSDKKLKVNFDLLKKRMFNLKLLMAKGILMDLENYQSLSKLRSHQKSVAIRSVWLINLMNILRA